MNTNHRPNREPSLREVLAAMGIESVDARIKRLAHERSDRHLAQLLESRRAAESAIGLAMVTSAIPGIEVTYIDVPAGSSSHNPGA